MYLNKYVNNKAYFIYKSLKWRTVHLVLSRSAVLMAVVSVIDFNVISINC